MPVAPTYPGVYIEEIPSGVRTITGVATSITAFIGRAARGPVDEPTTINNFGDYERLFGGLSVGSTMSYAVRDFYLNGGAQAIIVRIHKGATAASISLPTGAPDPNDELRLEAASVGSWGNNLSAVVDYDTKDKDDPHPQLFNLTVSEKNGATEKFLNVSIDTTNPRYLPRVLEQNSSLVRVAKKDNSGKLIVPNVRPVATASTPLSPPSSPPTSPPSIATPGADGSRLTDAQFFSGANLRDKKEGLYALEKADLFNLLCIPSYTSPTDPTSTTDVDPSLVTEAAAYCKDRRAMLLVDPPSSWTNKKKAKDELDNIGTRSNYAALFFPRLKQPNPLRENQVEEFVPCGAVAGVFARTDAQRGVWNEGWERDYEVPEPAEPTFTEPAG